MMQGVTLGLLCLRRLQLHVDGNRNMSDAPLLDRRPYSEIGYRFHVSAAHHAVVITGDIDEEFIELNILLLEGPCYIIKLHSGDGQYWLLIHLGVVQSVQQMDAARP